MRKIVAGNWKMNGNRENLLEIKKVDVELIWEPPWGLDMMSDEAKLELGFM